MQTPLLCQELTLKINAFVERLLCDMHLRALREQVGLTILDVSRVLNCSESSIRNWEKGRTTPKLEIWQVFRLRDLYGCTEAELKQAVIESMGMGGKE